MRQLDSSALLHAQRERSHTTEQIERSQLIILRELLVVLDLLVLGAPAYTVRIPPLVSRLPPRDGYASAIVEFTLDCSEGLVLC
jgi:hypothetical protein